MKICFFGVGGVGGYFGTLINNQYKNIHDVYFIARGQHKDAINSSGLTLKKSGGVEIINTSPKICTDKVDDLPECDIIILSVKGYDLKNAVKQISKITSKKTIILPLLNGVDIYDRIKKHLNKRIVLPSCVYVGTHIESPGVIYQKGGSCKISIGVDPNFPNFNLEPLFSILKGSDIDFDLEKDVKIPIWSKFMFIAAYGLVAATFDKTIGEILADEKLSNTVKSIMNEIHTIARKINISLADDIVETSYQKAKQFPFEAKTSFQRDVEAKGKINEGDLFGGAIIRYGLELSIPTPNTEKVYHELLNKFD